MGPDSNGWSQRDYETLITCAVRGHFQPEHWQQFCTVESGLVNAPGKGPRAKNPYADANGLWQAMGTTLKNLGYTKGGEGFRAETVSTQIEWSLKYLDDWRNRYKFQTWKRPGDQYLCNFTPAFLPHKDNPHFIIFSSKMAKNTYWVNRGLDKRQKGHPDVFIEPPEKYAKEPRYRGKGYINVQDMALATEAAATFSVYKQAVRSLDKLLQEGLNRRGEALVVDGILGPKSLAALDRFWTKVGFDKEDRVLDAHTRHSLL